MLHKGFETSKEGQKKVILFLLKQAQKFSANRQDKGHRRESETEFKKHFHLC